MRQKELFLASPTGQIYVISGSGESLEDMFENHPESVASSLSHEYIHTILDKMKKLKASSALDRNRAAKIASLVPSSNTQDLDRLLDDSQERLTSPTLATAVMLRSFRFGRSTTQTRATEN